MPELSRSQLLVYGASPSPCCWSAPAGSAPPSERARPPAAERRVSFDGRRLRRRRARHGRATWSSTSPGAVRDPGVYRLPAGSRVDRRGGARRRRSRAARRGRDQPRGAARRRPAGRRARGRGAAGALGRRHAEGPISLGTATVEQLDTIEGIGPVTAQNIIEFRDQHGGLSSIDQLDQISGIGPATMEALRAASSPRTVPAPAGARAALRSPALRRLGGVTAGLGARRRPGCVGSRGLDAGSARLRAGRWHGRGRRRRGPARGRRPGADWLALARLAAIGARGRPSSARAGEVDAAPSAVVGRAPRRDVTAGPGRRAEIRRVGPRRPPRGRARAGRLICRRPRGAAPRDRREPEPGRPACLSGCGIARMVRGRADRPTGRRRGGLAALDRRIRDRAEAALGARHARARGGARRAASCWARTTASTPRTVDDFKRSGLAHLLAVSGQNVMLLCLLALAAAGARWSDPAGPAAAPAGADRALRPGHRRRALDPAGRRDGRGGAGRRARRTAAPRAGTRCCSPPS